MSANKKKSKKKKFRLLKGIVDTGVFLLVVLTITYVLHTYVVERCEIHNHSMEPTLEEGNIILVDKLTYRRRSPERFEIITFNNSSNKEDLIKRVIGLPGETVRIVQGKIFIDGNAIDDIEGLDVPADAGVASSDFKLGDDEYFVIGDNRKESIDSRSAQVGPVRTEDIIGRAFIRLKPLSKMIIR